MATPNKPNVLLIERAALCRIFEKPLEASELSGVCLPVWGILGIINIDVHFFLCVVTEKSPAAQLKGDDIFEITSVRLIPFAGNDA